MKSWWIDGEVWKEEGIIEARGYSEFMLLIMPRHFSFE
jgi:hypothetical protein